MLLQSNIAAWEVWAVMLILVAPLYTQAAYMLWKRWQTTQNMDDIEDHSDEIGSNSDEIQKIRETLVEIQYELDLVKNDLQVLHDITADSNHCGSSNCRWCEGEPDEEE